MPYKDKEDYTRYLREYMQRRRVKPGVKPDVKPTPEVVKPQPELVKPVVLNPVKPLFDSSVNERLARSNRVKYGGKK